jgi:hypothetical protein
MGVFTFWQKHKSQAVTAPVKPRPTPQIHTGPDLTVTQRVQNGAAILDEALPGWEKHIDRSTLNIASGGHCVLGQIFGNFGRAVRVLHLPLAVGQDLNPSNLGFDCTRAENIHQQRGRISEWHELNDGWQKFLAEREHEQAYQAKDA